MPWIELYGGKVLNVSKSNDKEPRLNLIKVKSSQRVSSKDRQIVSKKVVGDDDVDRDHGVMQENNMSDLCTDIQLIVLSYLDGKSLCRVGQVNRSIWKLADTDSHWRVLCKLEWGVSSDQLQTPPPSFKELYKLTYQSVRTMIRDFLNAKCLSSIRTSLPFLSDNNEIQHARHAFMAYTNSQRG